MVGLTGCFARLKNATGPGLATLVSCLFAWACCCGRSLAQEVPLEASAGTQVPAEQDPTAVDFVRDVLPIFKQHCLDCHGPSLQESNLRLDVRESALGIADFGKSVIVPGNSAESQLYLFISGQGTVLMPPEDVESPLSREQIETVRRWIEQGANWPDEWSGSAPVKLESDHWSFQPIGTPVPPDRKGPDTFPVRNPIDAFVLDRLSERQLSPSVAAEPKTLIRRLLLDVHGLLPTPEEVDQFQADPSDAAYEQLVDRVLASPRYGERWARHWLDVVRFGESTGYETNRDRANAYYYRDYVIEALNQDKPYRQFVLEQLAGDALGADAATGFLVGGPYDIVKSPDLNLTLMQRQDELADFVNTTSTAFLGLTVACARCHNHKFDPILQRDYYAIQAVFAGVTHGERPLLSSGNAELQASLEQARARVTECESKVAALRGPTTEVDSAQKLPRVNAQENSDPFEPVVARHVRFRIDRTNQYEPCLDELEIYGPTDSGSGSSENLALASRGATVASSGDYGGNPIHQLKLLNDGVHGNSHSWICDQKQGWAQISLPQPQTIDRVVWGRDRQAQFQDRLAVRYAIEVSLDGTTWQEVSSSKRRLAYLENGKELNDEFLQRIPAEQLPAAQQALTELDGARDRLKQLEQQIPIAYIGKFEEAKPIHRLHRGDPMSPREEVPPDTLTLLGTLQLSSSTPEQERRRKLAEWIVSDQNPLTARVIVNRVWNYHFGKGLVATTSDFGKNGESPTHPELLDWLASEFIRQGWSLKWLHRQILTSSTYRQSSRPRDEALAIDAETRMLWRFPPRRLEAEAIRDCVLQSSGKLDLTMGGPGFLLFKIDRENVHHYFPLEKFEPQHFRRMIYMTKIRQEQDDVFGQFDCPDAGQVIPNRNQSTTPLQALNLLNSPFIVEQADEFANRLQALHSNSVEMQVTWAYRILFSRDPQSDELQVAVQFVRAQGLAAFCRALLNANEFLYLS